jgi:hypothetical protein
MYLVALAPRHERPVGVRVEGGRRRTDVTSASDALWRAKAGDARGPDVAARGEQSLWDATSRA